MSEQYDDLDLTEDDGTQPARPTFVPGNYIVTCVNVVEGGKSKWPRVDPDTKEPMLDEAGNKLYPDQWKWMLRIDAVDSAEPDEDQEALVGKEVHQWTNKGLGERGHTSLFINALMGRTVARSEGPRMSWVLGKQALANIEVKESGAPRVTLRARPAKRKTVSTDQIEQMARQAQGDEQPIPDSRDAIMEDLMYVEDRRDFGPILDRMKKLGLSDDKEVKSVYDLNHSRVVGHPQATKRNTQQPALVAE